MASSNQPALRYLSAAIESRIGGTDAGGVVYTSQHYSILPTRGVIRILNVFPGNPDELKMHCELIIGDVLDYKGCAELTPPPVFKPYDALSWCWGKQIDDSWINIWQGGRRFAKSVKSELLAALRAIRHHEHDMPHWIDAVCIDHFGNTGCG